MKQSLAIQLHHTNSITILKLVINLISSSISIIRVLAFVELINTMSSRLILSGAFIDAKAVFVSWVLVSGRPALVLLRGQDLSS
jgi:hypothetical protein